VFSWLDFEQAAPELAALGRERVERHGFMMLGTVRRDGTARISAVEVRLVRGHLTMSVIRGSAKEHDVRRDPRILLHSPMLNADDPNDEFKLRGRAVAIEDQGLRAAAASWNPPPELEAFVVDLESAAFLAWSEGEMRMTRWSRAHGLHWQQHHRTGGRETARDETLMNITNGTTEDEIT
jgi:Pyridoxamine 5'-phosphate oxidase